MRMFIFLRCSCSKGYGSDIIYDISEDQFLFLL